MAVISSRAYSENVFINCPFDPQYEASFRALVYCVMDVGFRPRCALEIDDGAEVRIEKLFRIIGDCCFGIHDLSRTQLDASTDLPRFNMPLELGMFLAARRFGSRRQKRKNCLILDSDPFRYQAFISDISGQDIRAHNCDLKRLITLVRNWLRTSSGKTNLPGGAVIFRRFQTFNSDLPELCSEAGLDPEELTLADYAQIVRTWIVNTT